MKTFPTPEEWFAATRAGFRPKGATLAPASLCLVPITNGDNSYPPLPVDLLLYRYWHGGDELDREDADREFLEFMTDIIEESMWWFLHPFARRRAARYFDAVRFGGEKFFNYQEKPVA